MVRISVLRDSLNNIINAEKRGKRQPVNGFHGAHDAVLEDHRMEAGGRLHGKQPTPLRLDSRYVTSLTRLAPLTPARGEENSLVREARRVGHVHIVDFEGLCGRILRAHPSLQGKLVADRVADGFSGMNFSFGHRRAA